MPLFDWRANCEARAAMTIVLLTLAALALQGV